MTNEEVAFGPNGLTSGVSVKNEDGERFSQGPRHKTGCSVSSSNHNVDELIGYQRGVFQLVVQLENEWMSLRSCLCSVVFLVI